MVASTKVDNLRSGDSDIIYTATETAVSNSAYLSDSAVAPRIDDREIGGADNLSIQEQYDVFFSKRDVKKKEAYSKAVYAGWTMALFGGLGDLLCASMWQFWDSFGLWYLVLTALIGFFSGFVIVAGICIIMTVPTSEFNIDEANRRNPILGKICLFFWGIGVFFFAIVLSFAPPRTGVVMWPALFHVWSHIFLPDRTPLPNGDIDYWRLLSTKINVVFALAPIGVYSALFMIAISPVSWARDMGSYGKVYATWMQLLKDKQPISTIYYVIMASIYLGFNINFIRLLVLNRPGAKRNSDSTVLDATTLVYIGWISLLTPTGVICLGNWVGFGPLHLAPSYNDSWTNGIIGVAIILPMLIFILFGRNLMGYWARRFELDVDQLFDDGAVLAALAASSDIHDEVTNVTWIPRSPSREGDPQYDSMVQCQPHCVDRRFWIKGTTSNKERVAGGTQLTVEVSIDNFGGDCDLTWSSQYVNSKLVTYNNQIQYVNRTMNCEEWLATNMNSNNPDIALIKSNFFEGSMTFKVFIKDSNKTKDSLRSWATSNLRLFEWKEKYNEGDMGEKDFLFDLLKKSPRELKTPEDKKMTFELSSPHAVIDNDSKIDFFVSHSWMDDPKLKVELLRNFAIEFYTKNGRYPNLWLDKVCIDQSDPDDAIAVLPINIGACKNMLILMSPSYLTRLWCVWELLTLFTFCNKDIALERINILPVCQEKELNSLLEQFDTFDWNHAHCFSPNEEYKMRQIMRNVGMERLANSMQEVKAILIESKKLTKSWRFATPSFSSWRSQKKRRVKPEHNEDITETA